jgi:hypothetical protein
MQNAPPLGIPRVYPTCIPWELAKKIMYTAKKVVNLHTNMSSTNLSTVYPSQVAFVFCICLLVLHKLNVQYSSYTYSILLSFPHLSQAWSLVSGHLPLLNVFLISFTFAACLESTCGMKAFNLLLPAAAICCIHHFHLSFFLSKTHWFWFIFVQKSTQKPRCYLQVSPVLSIPDTDLDPTFQVILDPAVKIIFKIYMRIVYSWCVTGSKCSESNRIRTNKTRKSRGGGIVVTVCKTSWEENEKHFLWLVSPVGQNHRIFPKANEKHELWLEIQN